MSKAVFYIANKTMPHAYNTSKGKSKNPEWMQVAGVPCVMLKATAEAITLNCFGSSSKRTFDVDVSSFNEHFTQVEPDAEGNLHLDSYPVPVNVSEFRLRDEVSELEKKMKKITKDETISECIRTVIKDKLFQMMVSQGCMSTATLEQYFKYKKGELKLGAHQRVGDALFNRASRWMPPVDITYEEFSETSSFPAPLGIRPKDFCLPSELIVTATEMITQIANFEGVSQADFDKIQSVIPGIEKRIPHVCKYCGSCINIAGYSSSYKSCTNFIEICHRDPEERFIKKNMYWGHGECNRRQGGYSELDRIDDGLRLLMIHGKITQGEYFLLKGR